MMQHIWKAALSAAALVAATLNPAVAAAQAPVQGAYPEHSLTWIVPYAAGAATDSMARILAKELSRSTGQPVVIENKPGAATINAAVYLKNSPADGYRLMSADLTTLVLNPVLQQKNIGYKPLDDFTMIGLLAKLPLVLVARADFPANSLTQFLDYAAAHPNQLTYASPGLGSPHHMAMELLQSQTSVAMLHVPYNGTAATMTDILAGRIDVMFASVGSVAQYLATGKLKAFGISGDKAFETLPAVPPLQTSDKRLAGFEAYAWQGLVAPVGLPAAQQELLSRNMRAALEDPNVVSLLVELGLQPMPSTSQEMRAYVIEQTKVWQAVAKEKKLTLK
jgi:tripartite-type tricarboxylate transporter receptor subunit TctC